MKPTLFHTLRSAALLVLALPRHGILALEFRPLTLLSETTSRHSLKTATGRTLSDHRTKHAATKSALQTSSYVEVNGSRHLSFMQTMENDTEVDVLDPSQYVGQIAANATDVEGFAAVQVGGPKLADVELVNSSTATSASLSPAPAGYVWVIRESSDQQHAPLLSEYVPEPQDTFVDQAGSPWKLVAGSSKAESLVVELIYAEQWAKELDETKRQALASAARLPFSTRQVHTPPWLPSFAAHLDFVTQAIERPLNDTGALLETAEDSPFVLQQVMPLVLLVGNIPSSLGQRLNRVAAAVAGLGLITAQVMALAIMTSLLLFFLAIDKGYECCKRESQRNAEVSERADWWRQLTSWETMPGVDLMEGQHSDFHLG